jgi:4-amino-4-deoxy-L-arabinose transferase-like glycosyltransferase
VDKEILKNGWKYLLILLLVSFPIFQHLDSLTIRIWDESRLAINAYEMYHNGNYLIPTYDGEPDMWNTKPPLMIWLQVISMKIFGISEFSVRFPSALAAFFTCLSLLIFSVRYVKNFWFGLICVMALVTTTTFIDNHASRTGDYDALLTLFLTLS